MEYNEHMKPEDASFNEVGLIIAGDNQRGLLVISENPDATPMSFVYIPASIRSDYHFTVEVNTNVAFFLGALQQEAVGEHVDDQTLAAGRIVWWLLIENARHELEIANATD